MSIITKETFHELSGIESANCISVYIPTEREGDNKQGKIRLKNHTRRIQKLLFEKGMQGEKIEAYLSPLQKLIDDTTIWRNLSDGLAVFLSREKFAYSTVPVHFNDYSLVSNRFYLLPLMPVFSGDGRFFILTLSSKKSRLFECTRDFITEIEISDLVPDTILDATGYDVEQKSLQHRTGQAGFDKTMYHGQGEGKDDKKKELQKYLREVESGISGYLKGYDAPLVIGAVDYLFAMYKEINQYSNLYSDNISGNFDDVDPGELHTRAWSIIEDYFNRFKESSRNSFFEKAEKSKASSNLKEIIPAAVYGNIDTLFVSKNARIWGQFQPENENILVHEEKQVEDECLLDLSAKSTFLQGGKVYLIDQNELPEKDSVANAIFRY